MDKQKDTLRELRNTCCKLIKQIDQLLQESPETVKSVNEENLAVSKTPVTSKNLERAVTDCMHQIGIPVHIMGYEYIRRAIIIGLEGQDIRQGITTWLYPSIAKEFQTAPSRVERGIRYAIAVAWSNGNTEYQDQLFGHTISAKTGKPTPTQFLAKIVEHIKMEMQ